MLNFKKIKNSHQLPTNQIPSENLYIKTMILLNELTYETIDEVKHLVSCDYKIKIYLT